LSLDDLLAARCVCKAWHNSLSTGWCSTWRLPQSLWQNIEINQQTHETMRAAAAAYAHTPTLLLDSGTGRPSVPMQLWGPLLKRLRRWFIADGPEAVRHIRLHLRNPPSPKQLIPFKHLSYLHSLRIQHGHAAVYSRHLVLLAELTQLQELELHMDMPRLELRSLAHQRLRRTPVNGDFLSSLTGLRRLEVTCTAHTGVLTQDVEPGELEPGELQQGELGPRALQQVELQLLCVSAASGEWAVSLGCWSLERQSMNADVADWWTLNSEQSC
jgi:hypothetical protein